MSGPGTSGPGTSGTEVNSAGTRVKDLVVNRRLPWRLVFLAAIVTILIMPEILSSYRLDLLSKYVCLAILSLGIGLAWGHGGMLTLGQGLFFGLGAYSMGMYLKLHQAGPGKVPDFMTQFGVRELQAMWVPFRNPVFAIAAVLLLPALVACLLGYLIFRQRVRGAYFAILTQALAAAFALLLVNQLKLTNGTNGLTGFRKFFGIKTATDEGELTLYFIATTVMLITFLLLRLLVRSRFGRLLLAVRDGEDRVRFLGYDPTIVKTITFAISGITASVAGALYAPIVGIVNPSLLDIVPSIGFVIAVAVGGRFSLIGAMVGAIVVNWTAESLSTEFPSGWVYFQGALFIGVIAFAPKGLAGLFNTVKDLVAHLLASVGGGGARRNVAIATPGGSMPERAGASGPAGPAGGSAGGTGQDATDTKETV